MDTSKALEFKPEERAAFLAGACGSDVEMRRRVEELLQAEAEAGDFLPSEPGGALTVLVPVADTPGDRIDRYKLLEKVGEGGFGAVYVAEQREPVKRRVALKIIKLGMNTKQVVARFEAERQALALMDHPNIAKVLDAGATETGRPYFVMELVRGIKITDYCDQNNLPTVERLRLFIQVCHAIQHAHQKGVIHRDIKPSRILVTLHDGVPVPKVIDFGIAKATQQELTEKTVFTQFQQFIGTPAYETANSLAMDIQRHLHSEPVEARPPSQLYRLQKLARRNKTAFAASAGIAIALFVGSVVSTWQAVRATRAEREQIRSRQQAEANEQKAQQAQASEAQARRAADEARQNEAQLRQRAESQELAARQRAYASDMNLAQQALAVNNLGKAWEL